MIMNKTLSPTVPKDIPSINRKGSNLNIIPFTEKDIVHLREEVDVPIVVLQQYSNCSKKLWFKNKGQH